MQAEQKHFDVCTSLLLKVFLNAYFEGKIKLLDSQL